MLYTNDRGELGICLTNYKALLLMIANNGLWQYWADLNTHGYVFCKCKVLPQGTWYIESWLWLKLLHVNSRAWKGKNEKVRSNNISSSDTLRRSMGINTGRQYFYFTIMPTTNDLMQKKTLTSQVHTMNYMVNVSVFFPTQEQRACS